MIDISDTILMMDRYHLHNINGDKNMVGSQKTFIWLGGIERWLLLTFNMSC
jgi:hypothetical protein